MTPIAAILFAIILNFAAVSMLKKWLNLKLGALFIAVTISWLSLMVLDIFNKEIDGAVTALLISQVLVGIAYVFKQKIKPDLYVFRLPLLLTITLIVFAIIKPFTQLWQAYGLLALLWVGYIGYFAIKHLPYHRQPASAPFSHRKIG